MRQPVLLIDADARSCGDQNVITGIKPKITLKELSQYKGALNHLSPEQKSNIWAIHERTGMAYIGAVKSVEESLAGQSSQLNCKRNLHDPKPFVPLYYH